MSAEHSSERSPGARPVADAPVEQLSARADELARRWAVSLLSARPLSEMSAVPLDELARDAPTLCAQLARSLRSDAELAQLLASPPLQGLAQAAEPSAAVRNVEALRGIVWQGALAALDEPSSAQVADLADRLAFVCASLLAAALARQRPASAGGAEAPSGLAGRTSERILYRSPPLSSSGPGAVLIDERDELAATASPDSAQRRDAAKSPPRRRESTQAPASAAATASPRPASAPATKPRARPWDTPLSEAGAAELRVTRGRGSPVDERA